MKKSLNCTPAASFGAALLTMMLIPSVAAAQAAPEELARRLVGQGIEAAKSRDWMTARDRFQRAYEIQPLPLTLYNLAAAQEKTGQFVEADRSYRIFLRETTEGENANFRKAASERRIALRTKIAYVVIRAENVAPDDVLTVGGQEIAAAVLGESIPTNPGNLQISVSRGGAVVAGKAIRLEPGDSRVVQLDVPPAPLPEVTISSPPPPPPGGSDLTADTTATTRPPEEDSGILGSPVFWVIVGGVVLAGAGVGVYFATRPEDPFDSTLDSVSIVGR